MIQRVYEQVDGLLDDTVVATDDQRIYDHVRQFGGSVVMTSPMHQSGTDRCQEALELLGGLYDVVINIQGDEPFVQASQIELLKSCFEEEGTELATLVKPFEKGISFEELSNPNTPKVVLNAKSEALYFSRAVIPYQRNQPSEVWSQHHTYYKHIGLYAYRADVLAQITGLPQSSHELAESLEQLRWLEAGFRIKVAVTHSETIGIDTPEDLERAESYLVSK